MSAYNPIHGTLNHLYRFQPRHLALRISERKLLLCLVDTVLLLIASLGAVGGWTIFRPDLPLSWHFISFFTNWIIGLPALWLILLATYGGYNLKISAQTKVIQQRLIGVWITFIGIYLLAFFLLARQVTILPLPVLDDVLPLRLVPGLFIVMALPLELIWRHLYAKLLTKNHFQQHVLIVGAGKAGQILADAFHHEIPTGAYNVVGFIDDDQGKIGKTIKNLPVLGPHKTMVKFIKQHNIDEVILAISQDLSGDLFQTIMECYEQGIQITPMPVIYEALTGRVPVEHVGRQWYVSLPLSATPPGWFYKTLIRTIDICAALLGLLGLGIICPVIALANVFWSPGALFYRQTRVGRAGKLYSIVKFRTMIPNAEGRSGAVWAAAEDPRITLVGHLLRKSRLDEVPQFWNILKGEMSLVGPRPERPEFVEQLAKQIPFYKSRHAVKPGLTGWAQVRYPYGASVEDALMKLQYDLYYIKHQNLFLNFLIIYKTIRVVFGLKGR